MAIVDDNLVGGGLHIDGLAPKQVGSLVIGHLALLRQDALLPAHLKRVGSRIFNVVDTRVIAIHVNRRTAVTPINLQRSRPYVLLAIEGIEHVGGAVARSSQVTWGAIVVIDNIHAHAVARDEAVVGGSRHILLTQVATQLDGIAASSSILNEEGVTAGNGNEATHHQADDFSCG